jgi:hypothetical protein
MGEFTTLVYYEDKTLKKQIYNKYEINEECIIRHKKLKKPMTYHLFLGYHKVYPYDDTGKQMTLSVARAMLSTFVGPPPTPQHTADHIQSKNKTDNHLSNLRWTDESGQRTNQNRSDTQNNAFIIVHDGEEMTSNEWAERTGVHNETILKRARNENNTEWSFKTYDDLPGEIWKDVEKSETWKASNLGRVAYHSKHTRKVYSPEELYTYGGYPSIKINGTHRSVHSVVFQTFHPNEYDAMQKGEMVLHENDDKTECQNDKLRVGTRSQNTCDAHDNGKYDGKKNQRKTCMARKGDWSNPFDSLADAVKWLRTNTCYDQAVKSSISECLNGKRKSAYGYTWSSS